MKRLLPILLLVSVAVPSFSNPGGVYLAKKEGYVKHKKKFRKKVEVKVPGGVYLAKKEGYVKHKKKFRKKVEVKVRYQVNANTSGEKMKLREMLRDMYE